jgi:Flp pilus assembly protein TadB
MNSVITWSQLITFLIVFLAFYYAIVVLVYYRKDLSFLARTSKRSATEMSGFHRVTSSSAKAGSSTEDVSYAAVHDLLEDLKPVFEALVTQSLAKEQVLEALQIRVRNYPTIKDTGFQTAVNNHIEQELQARSGMVVLDHELVTLWQ